MRLGQAHRAGPLARRELRKVNIFLLFGSVQQKTLGGADRQARIHRPRLIGRILHFIKRNLQHVRQALATVLGFTCQPRPPCRAERRVRVLEAARRFHRSGRDVVRAAFGIARLIDRQQQLFAKLAGFFDYLIERVGIEVCVARQRLQHLNSAEHFMHHKLLVAKRGFVNRHGNSC